MEKEIIEGNVAIAKFMNKTDVLGVIQTEPFVTNVYFPADQIESRRSQGVEIHLYYHSSWDWIIPACHKFDNLETKEFNRNQLMMHEIHCYVIQDAVVRHEILPVFEKLTDAIRWYNNQNKEK